MRGPRSAVVATVLVATLLAVSVLGLTAPATVAAPTGVWVVLAGLVALLLVRHRWARRAHQARVAARAARAERVALAEDMHDVLGHELALLATAAARLEMTPGRDPAGQAATIRERAADAVERLHDVLRLLGHSGRTDPAALTPRAVVDQARAAGMTVHATGLTRPIGDPVVSTALSGLLREALTNAARHAPGRPVDVELGPDGDRGVRLLVTNPAATRPGPRSGLASWERRVRVIGGTLHVTATSGVHRLEATLPHDADLRGRLDGARPEPAPWVLDLAVPLILLTALVLGGWSAAAHDRTVSAEDVARLQVGMPAARAQELLPPREALLLLTPVAPAPPGSRCGRYSDGSLPLAQASFVVCTRDGVVTAVEDLR